MLPKGVTWSPTFRRPGRRPKEALEEAGIREVDARSLGSYDYEKWGGVCEVQVFPMAVTEELRTPWPEAHIRRREWLPLAEAKERLAEDGLRALVDLLPDRLNTLSSC